VHEIAKKALDHLVTGNALYSMKKYEDAIDSFNKSLLIDPENTIAWNNKGLALAKSGKIEEAIICYDKALKIDPEDCVFLNNKGNALYKKGEIREALKNYQMAFELNPESSAAIKGMEMCLSFLKKSGNLKKKAQKPKTLF
ncbi:MAG: tetratricopeptide repeat protein, partial [Candidatus Methanoperedens sp.]|nr:tetratricopeptide repeat protein [Candidatus Methanoperedens sp.]